MCLEQNYLSTAIVLNKLLRKCKNHPTCFDHKKRAHIHWLLFRTFVFEFSVIFPGNSIWIILFHVHLLLYFMSTTVYVLFANAPRTSEFLFKNVTLSKSIDNSYLF